MVGAVKRSGVLKNGPHIVRERNQYNPLVSASSRAVDLVEEYLVEEYLAAVAVVHER